MDNLKYWIWLSSIPKVGSRRCIKLLEHFIEPENIWRASKDELLSLPFLNVDTVNQISQSKLKDEASRHLENIFKKKIKVITINDEDYPFYLKNIHDPPVVLYVNGEFIKEDKFVAIVGSRKASSYGKSMAEQISQELSGAGITIVSGMARGIDSSAHNGALKAGGRTIAVLGCGPDLVYPPENKNLMERIRQSGSIISEYIPGTPPLPMNFPARNRIISGLSLGVVIVEAGEKSGSLITADFALEQGREVFSVPGNICSINSTGTNKLIKDGAKVVTCIEDILEELNVTINKIDITGKTYSKRESNTKKRKSDIDSIEIISHKRSFEGLDKNEIEIVKQLEIEALHIDHLAKKCGFNIQTVNSILVILEMKGIIEQMAGKMFKLID